jgi:hypothetical protein
MRQAVDRNDNETLGVHFFTHNVYSHGTMRKKAQVEVIFIIKIHPQEKKMTTTRDRLQKFRLQLRQFMARIQS